MRLPSIFMCLLLMNGTSIENKIIGIIRHDVDIERYRELGRRSEFSCVGRYSSNITTEGVFPDKMPTVVMKAASEGFPGYELSNFFYITAPDKSSYYSIDASSDDEDLTLSFSPNGKLLEKEAR